MRFFFSGPRFLGIRPGILFKAGDFVKMFKLSIRPTSQPPPSFIYVIEGEGGKHKIGVSSDPIRRISTLQTGSPVPLKFSFIAVAPDMPASYFIESQAHELLQKYNTSGEWFAVPASVAIGAVFEGSIRSGYPIQQVKPKTVPTIISLAKSDPIQAPWIDRHPLVFWFAIISLLWSIVYAYYLHRLAS